VKIISTSALLYKVCTIIVHETLLIKKIPQFFFFLKKILFIQKNNFFIKKKYIFFNKKKLWSALSCWPGVARVTPYGQPPARAKWGWPEKKKFVLFFFLKKKKKKRD
jgi:hypothetical protein